MGGRALLCWVPFSVSSLGLILMWGAYIAFVIWWGVVQWLRVALSKGPSNSGQCSWYLMSLNSLQFVSEVKLRTLSHWKVIEWIICIVGPWLLLTFACRVHIFSLVTLLGGTLVVLSRSCTFLLCPVQCIQLWYFFYLIKANYQQTVYASYLLEVAYFFVL
jgi:hypothetical protein